MKIYKTKYFTKWQLKNTELNDVALSRAIDEINQGLFEANLGGNLYKKRAAMSGKGKSGSYRVILVGKLKENLWIYIYGFEKSERSNIKNDELEDLKELAIDLLNIPEHKKTEVLIEVKYYE